MPTFGSIARILAAMAFVGAMSGEAGSQTADDQRGRALAETARAIAATINANTAKAAGAPITFEGATSHDNFVELTYVVGDAAAFSRLKSNADQVRRAKASYYCNDSRIAYLKQGVVMHEIVVKSDRGERLDFIFDMSSCGSLPTSKLADLKTLADLALSVAKAENETVQKGASSPFRLDGAVAHQGVVEERFIVLDASARANAQANRANIAGVLTGYYCTKYGDFISQGLVLHHFFVLPDGSPVIDFTIDKSRC